MSKYSLVVNDDASITIVNGKKSYTFVEPLGEHIAKLDRIMAKAATENPEPPTDTERLAFVMEALGTEGMSAADYLKLRWDLFTFAGGEVNKFF